MSVLITYAESCADYAARAETCLNDVRRALDAGDMERARIWLGNAQHWLEVIKTPLREPAA